MAILSFLHHTFDAILSQIPRLFALIIGINKYKAEHNRLRPLRGAVPDGKEFKDYLMNRLCVPEGHIIALFDQGATRSAIINGFQKLRDNKNINEGDPIFIFYAGHGSQKPPHPNWEPQGPNAKMEVILPYDCDAVDGDGNLLEPIPDRTIGALIDEIAAKKGNNIVRTAGLHLRYHYSNILPSRLSCLTVAIPRRGRGVIATNHRHLFALCNWRTFHSGWKPIVISGIVAPERAVPTRDIYIVA
jgi:hypothetical protein